MRAKNKKGGLFDLLEALSEVQAQGLNLKALGISREVLTGLVKVELERRPKTQLETTLEWLKIAHPLPRSARPDADTDL